MGRKRPPTRGNPHIDRTTPSARRRRSSLSNHQLPHLRSSQLMGNQSTEVSRNTQGMSKDLEMDIGEKVSSGMRDPRFGEETAIPELERSLTISSTVIEKIDDVIE